MDFWKRCAFLMDNPNTAVSIWSTINGWCSKHGWGWCRYVGAVAPSAFDRSTCCWFPPFPCKMKSLLITSLLSFVIPIRWHQVRQFIVRVTYWLEYFDFGEFGADGILPPGKNTTPGYLYALMATIKWVFRGANGYRSHRFIRVSDSQQDYLAQRPPHWRIFIRSTFRRNPTLFNQLIANYLYSKSFLFTQRQNVESYEKNHMNKWKLK